MLIATTFGTVQAATPNVIGIDGYYHIKVAALMWQQGWRLLFPLDFPWLQLTILGPGHYSDHHFLFHVFQALFTQGDLRAGAKMAAVLFGTLGLYTSYEFLARRGVRYPLLWISLLIASAPTFIWRQSMARPQSLFLVLLVGAIWAVFAGRPRLLLPIGFLAAWLFDGFPFVLGVPAAAVAAHLACRAAGRLARRRAPSTFADAASADTRPAAAPADTQPALGPAAHAAHADGDAARACAFQSGPASGSAENRVPAAGTALLATPRMSTPAVAGPLPRSGDGSAASATTAPAAIEAVAADRSAAGDRPRLALVAVGWAFLGITLGLLLHPYVPRNLEFAYLHLLPKAVPSEQIDVPVGQEWNSFSARGFVTRAGPVAALTALGLVPPLLALARRRTPEWRAVMLGGIAVGFMVMAARSQRLIEYFPAFAVLFCAWSWAHPASRGVEDAAWLLRGARGWVVARLGERARRANALVAAGGTSVAGRFPAWWPWLAGAALAPVLVASIGVASRDARNGLAWDTYRDAALWLAANTPPGSRVLTTDWDDFPHMFFWNTHNTYLVGLDPTYMSLYDPALYRRWREVTSGRVPNPSRVIGEAFGARYVVSDRRSKHDAFLRAAAADPGLEEVLRTGATVVFRVRDARD